MKQSIQILDILKDSLEALFSITQGQGLIALFIQDHVFLGDGIHHPCRPFM